MFWESDHCRLLVNLGKLVTTDAGKPILQVVAIFCLCLIFSILFHKGFTDISVLIQDYPDDFWRALGEYFFDNLAGLGIKDEL